MPQTILGLQTATHRGPGGGGGAGRCVSRGLGWALGLSHKAGGSAKGLCQQPLRIFVTDAECRLHVP